jgi:hypothetical protein
VSLKHFAPAKCDAPDDSTRAASDIPVDFASVKRDTAAGEAGVRSVAPGFSRGCSFGSPNPEPALAGASFFRPLKRARNVGGLQHPRLNAGGYGPHAGYAGGHIADFAKRSTSC